MSRILVVDDEEAIRRMLRLMLEQDGHRVATAENGKEALKLIASETDAYDLVITDIVMPEKDGIELITELKRRLPHLRIIAISGGGQLSSQTYLRMAEVLKADLVLSKPIRMADLKKAVSSLMTEAN